MLVGLVSFTQVCPIVLLHLCILLMCLSVCDRAHMSTIYILQIYSLHLVTLDI